MIGPGNGVRVFLAAGTTDMRCGIAGLCARAKKVLGEDPASGAVFAFRGRMGDRLKILHWDGQGFCLYDKVLERGYFPWPKATEGKISLTPAQVAMLWAPLGPLLRNALSGSEASIGGSRAGRARQRGCESKRRFSFVLLDFPAPSW